MSPSTTRKNGVVLQEPAPNPVQYETSVYQNGLRYERPPFTFHSEQWESEAAKAMSVNSAGYAIGNAGSGETARKNVDAFKRWSVVPKRLVKSEELPDLTTKIMGHEFQFPIAAGPVGVLRKFFLLPCPLMAVKASL
jgi:lactate 2-monooxygenase